MLILLWLALAVAQADTAIDFQREIRPVLSENCFQCHGPDSTTRMAGLRLDRKEAAFEVRKSGAAVVPGKPAASLLYQRISAADAGRRMPPAYSHKTLNERQVDLLKRWIAQGAPWQEHWAFRAPVQPASSGRAESGVGAEPDRPLRPQPTRGQGSRSRARSRPPHPAPPRRARSHRPAAHARGDRRST